MKTAFISRVVVLFVLAFATPASALLVSVHLGTAAPPGELGGFTMAGFTDPRTLGDTVWDVEPPGSAPVTGNLAFDFGLEHFRVGQGWDTWSHGYTGDVYSFDEFLFGSTLELTLPGDTKAFYLYIEPDFFDAFAFEVKSDAATRVLDIEGDGGAQGIGFYTDDPLAESLNSIIITKLDDSIPGFAIGEFGINVAPIQPGLPDGSIPPLLTGAVLFALGAVRRWIKH